MNRLFTHEIVFILSKYSTDICSKCYSRTLSVSVLNKFPFHSKAGHLSKLRRL